MAVMAKEFYRFLQTAVGQQSTGSNFYPTTLDIQQSLRSGWLRKQGGVVRSWQRRWFTIKGDHAYYYATPDETKSPLGVIFLPGSRVVEHQFSATDPDKYLFEILPDGGDRQRMAPTHETYLLDAESDEERKEWIKAIKQVLYASVGGEKSTAIWIRDLGEPDLACGPYFWGPLLQKTMPTNGIGEDHVVDLESIFGRPLEETLHFEMVRDPRRKVPEIVQVCTEYILKKGLTEEGIFRLPGRTTLLKKICDDFDRGERPEIDVPEMDVHTVASLLKFYLRDLPGPLIPSEFYESVMRIIMREMPVAEETAFDRLNELIRSIPVANYNVLQYICQFLRKIASNADKNKMTPVNLATIFVQSFIRPEDDDPSLLMATASCRTMATLFLIERADRVFNVEYTSEGGAVVVDDLLGLESTIALDQFETAPAVSINPDLLGLEINGTGAPPPALRRHNAGRLSHRTASIEVVMGQGFLNENNKREAMMLPQLRGSDSSESEILSTNDELGSSEAQKPVPVMRIDAADKRKQPVAPPRPKGLQKPKAVTSTTTASEAAIPTTKAPLTTTVTTKSPLLTTIQESTPTALAKTFTKTKSPSFGTDSAAVETLISLNTQNFTELELRAHIERLCRELVVRQKIIEELSEYAQHSEQKHEKQVDALLQTMAKERSKSDKCSKKLQMFMEKYGNAE